MVNSNSYEDKMEYVASLPTEIIESLLELTSQTINIKNNERGYYLRVLAVRGKVEDISEVRKELELQLAEIKNYEAIAKENKKVL